MTNHLLRTARLQQGWTQQQLADFAMISLSSVERAERGEMMRVDTMNRLSECLHKSPKQLGLLKDPTENKNKSIGVMTEQWCTMTEQPPMHLWPDDLLTIYERGVTACQDLYYQGNPRQVEAILPLYIQQIMSLAHHVNFLQFPAARLASLAFHLGCELATDREDFGAARQTGNQAFFYAQRAGDNDLQVAALISLANLSWHLSSAQPNFIRKHSRDALLLYQQAISRLKNNGTPLLKGRTYAGIAEVYALQGQLQQTMSAMGRAYEYFPMEPENDLAYPYLRASRYCLYVFGDAQSRLLLGQPKEAEKALAAMQSETKDPAIEPITKVDLLYYEAEVQIQLKEIESIVSILAEVALLAKKLGSRLYFDKLLTSYHSLEEQWAKEPLITTLEEVFQPW